MVTIFLFQFVAIWNNFLLPYIMLADDRHVPAHRRALHAAATGANQPALYNLVITGRVAVDHPADRAVPDHAAVLADRPVRRVGEELSER